MVNTKSTAYSGSTATRASSAIARPAEMSTCAASAAQESANAAPTIARPKSSASTGGEMDSPARLMTTPGSATTTAPAMYSGERFGPRDGEAPAESGISESLPGPGPRHPCATPRVSRPAVVGPSRRRPG